MLVRITDQCDMMCSHCSINAGPDGQHMSMETFEQVLRFIDWTEIPLILISGGEPTLHPEFIDMLEKAAARFKVTVLSNGTFLDNDLMTKRILKTGALVQITNDDRFYPKKVLKIDHPQLLYEHHIRMVSPFGRAVTNKIPVSRQSPLCFNLRSVCRSVRDFKGALVMLRGMGKFCTPSINIDGSLSAGESNSCTTFGTIFDNNVRLTNGLCSMTCQKCGLLSNLSLQLKQAIGE
jgi:Radical SAM superfamily/4Fe-4S single cluster domain